MKNHIVLFFLLFFFLTVADAELPILTKKMLFLNARDNLLKNKWLPIFVHKNDNYDYVGVEKEFLKKKYPELMACSIDTSNCLLYYKKKGHCLKLETIGEHISSMEVVQWKNECPNLNK